MIRSSVLTRASLGLCLLSLLAGCPSADPPAENGNAGTPNSGTMNNASNQETCNNTCLSGESECITSSFIAYCETDDSGCRSFSRRERCGDGQSCVMGECQDDSVNNSSQECDSTCSFGDEPRCKAGSVQSCADHNNDGCLTYEVTQACGDGEQCTDEAGAATCEVKMCEAPCDAGATRCEGDLVQTCAEFDGCLQFNAGKECGDGQTCMGGECVAKVTCDDECIAGEVLCGPDNTPRECKDSDGDGCVEFVDLDECDPGNECRQGACVQVDTCEDLCVDKDKTTCDTNGNVQICRAGADGCLANDLLEDCITNGFACEDSPAGAGCVAPPMNVPVVINEIFYDAAGDDVNMDTGEAEAFVEIKGAPGADVAGWRVDLVNGSNGMAYNSMVLPAGATLDGNGLLVISNDNPTGFFRFAVSNVYPLIPIAGNSDGFQNGNDNVELFDASGNKVDALGYGSFSGAMFTGEGMPAPDVANDRSLGRVPGAADTDDNSVDFISYFPTPGIPNGDLMINEVYVDQPGADGQPGTSETFIEVIAPIQGWIDPSLDAYRLHAINGMDGMDYIFTGVDPGIEFSGATLGSAGSLIVCNIDNATDALLAMCSVPYEGPDFQNGPDSLVLTFGGRPIDAIAYGTFTASDTGAGEGSPVALSPTDAGKSLNRWPISDTSKELDTDDNATDFHLASPSPADPNEFPATP